MRTLWTALRHPIAVWRLSRTIGETQRREAIRYAHDCREYEAAVRRLDTHQAARAWDNPNADPIADLTKAMRELEQERDAYLSADADA